GAEWRRGKLAGFWGVDLVCGCRGAAGAETMPTAPASFSMSAPAAAASGDTKAPTPDGPALEKSDLLYFPSRSVIRQVASVENKVLPIKELFWRRSRADHSALIPAT